MDRTYVHQGRQQRNVTNWNYDQSNWDTTQQWNRARQPSRSQTPNSRRRSNSAKTPKGQRKGRGKGQGGGMGKGKGQLAPLPPPQAPWPGYAMHGLPVPPMPALPTPQLMPAAYGPNTTAPTGFNWPVMPQPPELPAPTSTTPSAQNPEEKELMEMIKTRQMELPPDLRMKVQNFTKKEGARATKDLHTAVRLQGRARQDLEDALQARFNLIATWKTFLSDAIHTWQEYATLFQQQEQDVQDKIKAAQDQFNQANIQLEQSQMAAGKVSTIEIKDEEDEFTEGQANILNASDKIHDSFKTLSTSLQQLQTQTEQIETEMKAAKRPRLATPSTADQVMKACEEGGDPPKAPPFTPAGCA